MKARKPRTSRVLLDVILSVMAMIILLIAPPTQGDLIPKVDYVLEVSWPDTVDVDVDTWVLRPDNVKMYYGNKDTGHVSIDRDDLGKRNDPAPPNIEVTNFRAPEDGFYYVSVHNYRTTGTFDPSWEVWVVFIQTGIKSRKLYTVSFPMPAPKQEVPVFMFELRDGEVVQMRKSDRYIVSLGSVHP